MKYNISFEITGEAKAYLEHLRAIVSEAFDVHRALLRAPPPHLTLKYSFHATPEQLKDLEAKLEAFVKTQQPSTMTLSGFDYFKGEGVAVFLHVTPSKAMSTTYKELYHLLKTLEWMEWREHDYEDQQFHASIATADAKGKEEEILAFLANKKKTFTLSFDNLTIAKREETPTAKWELHKQYTF